MSIEYLEPYSHTTPKAKKQHKCDECRGVIQRGERYNVHSGLCDGDWMTCKRCEDCEALTKRIDATISDPEERTALGMLHEQVFDGRDPDAKAEFIAIKRKRGGIIQDWMLKYESVNTAAN